MVRPGVIVMLIYVGTIPPPWAIANAFLKVENGDENGIYQMPKIAVIKFKWQFWLIANSRRYLAANKIKTKIMYIYIYIYIYIIVTVYLTSQQPAAYRLVWGSWFNQRLPPFGRQKAERSLEEWFMAVEDPRNQRRRRFPP